MKRKWVLRSESTYSKGTYGKLTLTKPHQNGGGNTGVSTSSRGGGSSSSSSSSSSSTRIHELKLDYLCMLISSTRIHELRLDYLCMLMTWHQR